MSRELDDAAARALWSLRNATTESVGVLYRLPDGSIAFTEPVAGGKNRAHGSFSIPAGSLLGIYHNHPLTGRERRDRYRRQFSPADVKQAQQLRVPSYILAGNRIFRYDPRPVAPDALEHVRGEPVLAEIPIDMIRAELMARIGRAPDDPRGPYLTPPAGPLAARGGLLSD